jgi:ribosomal protein S30
MRVKSKNPKLLNKKKKKSPPSFRVSVLDGDF